MNVSHRIQRPVQRAYVIVCWTDEKGEMWCLSGRERAVHKRALAELIELAPKKIEIDENGADAKNGIGKNLGGTLLIGRTALPGGRVDRGETFEQAAVRELAEEFGLSEGVSEADLVPIGTAQELSVHVDGSEIRFFALCLRNVFREPDVAARAAEFVRNFKPNSDKRSLEIVTARQLRALLLAPDEADEKYIEDEMVQLAKTLEPDDDAAALLLAAQLIEFQKRRSLQHQVDALVRFENAT